jgi:hypothetical protein
MAQKKFSANPIEAMQELANKVRDEADCYIVDFDDTGLHQQFNAVAALLDQARAVYSAASRKRSDISYERIYGKPAGVGR